jgi:hypothetical protein
MSKFDEDKKAKIEEKADKGSITAIQMLQKMEREEKLTAKKEEFMGKAMFGRPDDTKDAVKELPVMPVDRSLPTQLDELDIHEIDAYIQKGEFKSLPEHMTVYLKWMEEAHDWYYKFKSRNWVMRYLIANCQDKDGNHISYYMAEKIFNDMLSFFYADKNFKRNSWLRYLAERIEMGAALALEDNDFETYGKNLERAAKVISQIQLDKDDTDPRLLDRRPRFFATDAKELGVPKIDRRKLARQIDEMDISEAEKMAAKRDLGEEEREM